jgi:hypothetical protein
LSKYAVMLILVPRGSAMGAWKMNGVGHSGL